MARTESVPPDTSDIMEPQCYGPGAIRYDFYIISDDIEWESRILRKIEEKGHRGYDRGKFILGGMNSRARLYGVQNCDVVIIGFVSQAKKMEGDHAHYVAGLALEFWRDGRYLICIPTSKDSIVPKDFSAFSWGCSSMEEDELCNRISDTINSAKFERVKAADDESS